MGKCVVRCGLATVVLCVFAHAELFVVVVEDINDRTLDARGPAVQSQIVYGDHLYFDAVEGVHGQELWRTDGTAAGTELFKDIMPFDPYPKDPPRSGGFTWSDMGIHDGRLYFRANPSYTGLSGREPWQSDGTAAGTLMLKDVETRAHLKHSNPYGFTSAGGLLYFFTGDGELCRYDLWTSDGTESGTRMVQKDVAKATNIFGCYASRADRSLEIVDLNGTAYFTGRNIESQERQLWKTYGTPETTELVKESIGYSLVVEGTAGTPQMVSADGRIYFTGNDPAHGDEIWISDGTTAGTKLLKDIVPGPLPSGLEEAPLFLTPFGDGILFFAGRSIDDAPAGSYGLWRSNGTPEGTQKIVDVQPAWGPGSSVRAGANCDFTERIGDTFYYVACDWQTKHYQLWKTDGTSEGTTLVKDPIGIMYSADTDTEGRDFSRFELTGVGDTLYFGGHDPEHGWELWRSDGTTEGTYRVHDINPGPASSLAIFDAAAFRGLNDAVIFSADDGTHGRELWRSDGTAEGTWMLRDINIDTYDDEIETLSVGGDRLYFYADSRETGRELWIVDDFREGALRLVDASRVSASKTAVQRGEEEPVFYRGHYYRGGRELYQSDEVEEYGEVVVDIWPGEPGAYPSQLTVVHDRLYMTADHPRYGQSLLMLVDTEVDMPLLADRLLRRFDGVDYDENGRLNATEAQHALPNLSEMAFNLLDLNSDGMLTVVELTDDGEGESAFFEGENEGALPLAHSADLNADYRINLSELLRVVQLFNTPGGFACASIAGSEDGYMPGASAPRDCITHSADTSVDWKIDLSEILRIIQLFNADGYALCDESEDGVCPMFLSS